MSKVPEKWRELAHAEIDGAVIQGRIDDGEWAALFYPKFDSPNIEYRIDPKCDYALEKIPEKHRAAYLAWCDGAIIEFKNPANIEWEITLKNEILSWFDHFDYRIKSNDTKRWQWLFIGARADVTGLLTEEEAEEKRCLGVIMRKIPETEQEFDA